MSTDHAKKGQKRFQRTEAGDIAIEYIEKYAGELSKLEIAKLMHIERPDLYKHVENARDKVRYFTGAKGDDSRGYQYRDKFFCAYPEEQLQNLYFDISGNRKILLLGDIHVPFQDKKALDTAVNYGVKKGCDTIILNGDIFDHYAESFHEKEHGKRDAKFDYQQYQDFLFELRCAFPDASIILKLGNHEKRYVRWWLRVGMAQMLDIHAFTYEKIMQLDTYKVQLLDDYVTITLAGLNIIHGHEYRGAGGINPARWLSLRTGESTMCGHFHRTSEHSTKSHRGDVTSYWSVGCLCNLTPGYMPYNNWNHGFSFIYKEGDYFHVKNKRINDGMIL